MRSVKFYCVFAVTLAIVITLIGLIRSSGGQFSINFGPGATPIDRKQEQDLSQKPEPARPREKPVSRESPTPPVVQQQTHTLNSYSRARVPFDPKDPHVGGDARQIDPEEIRWLQEQLDDIPCPKPRQTNLAKASSILQRIGSLPYRTRNEGWIEPAITQQRGYGDCAAKSLWLATELIAAGYPAVSIVKGVPPNYINGQPGHAWVEILYQGQRYVSEATTQTKFFTVEEAPTRNYEVVARVYPLCESQP